MGEYVMSFMGIITNPKNENYIKKFLKKYINREYVIFINEKNIENMRNIKFETILLGRKFEENEILNEIIRKFKYLILNSDLKVYDNKLDNLNIQIITYGFNQKDTITMSLIHIQMCIRDKYNVQYIEKIYNFTTNNVTDADIKTTDKVEYTVENIKDDIR